jgi:OFA family oxalate/formate antiporter-like MFS transporter
MLFVFSMIFGFAFGATAPLNAALIGDTFGSRHIGLIMAIIEIGWESGAAFGPALAGYIFDITGSYSKAFLGSAIASFLGAALTILIKRPSGGSK